MELNEAGRQIASLFAVTRDDIARAKAYVIGQDQTNVVTMADEWLTEQKIDLSQTVNTDSPECPERLRVLAQGYSLRVALYQAVTELVVAGELLPAHGPMEWKPQVENRTSRYAGGLPVPLKSYYYPHIFRPISVKGIPTDPDIFLQGIDCRTLHAGIREGIEQALGCYQRGLYMPATVMLAAAVEGIWIECGTKVAATLGSTKMQNMIADEFGIGKIVAEVRKTLESKGKDLLKTADRTMAQVVDAEIWTTTLRDRRNALHWGKAKSFVADHSETGTLLMAAPIHIGTLEAIRAAC